MGELREAAGTRLALALTVLAVGGFVVLVAALLTRGGREDLTADEGLRATPVASATEAGTPTPTEDGEEGAADGDADAVLDLLAADGVEGQEVVVADLDGDGSDEVVVGSVVGGWTRVDVAARDDGGELALVARAEGGSADDLEALVAEDVDGTAGTLELVTQQRSGTQGHSASLWVFADQQLVPLAAQGGCWDGSHTYGIVGVEIVPPRIIATCDGSPDPIISWPSDTYVWDPEVEAFALESTSEA